MPFEFGDVLLVPFPFTSHATSKKRPAVVVSSRAYNTGKPDVIVMAVTSQLRANATLGEVWLRDWKSAGLLKPSAIKPRVRHSRTIARDPPTRRPRSCALALTLG